MYRDILLQAGLDNKEASVYEALLSFGSTKVKELIKIVSLKRGDLYNVLYRLRNKELIHESRKHGIAHFTLKNPKCIEELIAQQKQRLTNAEKALTELLPEMTKRYAKTSERSNNVGI